MDGKEFMRIRKALKMERLEFARALGYAGSDENATKNIRMIESGKSGISARMAIRAINLHEQGYW